MSFRPWREAAEAALYGPAGFFVREAPRDHFRTSVSASPAFGWAIRRLAGRVDDALGRPDPFDLVDVGAGRGELLAALPDVPARWRLTAVERAPDPGVPFRWVAEVPPLCGLLLANEWLDDVPVEVLVDGRVVEVAPDGTQRPGAPAGEDALDWAARWWPSGRRVEVGLARDRAWAAAVRRVRRGVAVAIDYGHVLGGGHRDDRQRDDRHWADRRPTLTGYRAGRPVRPVPDGSCDLTAHVALDSVAAATGSRLLRQREALRQLGVDAALPPRALASSDPREYARRLQAASSAAVLLDPAGLGGFGWLVRVVGCADPLPAGCGTMPR